MFFFDWFPITGWPSEEPEPVKKRKRPLFCKSWLNGITVSPNHPNMFLHGTLIIAKAHLDLPVPPLGGCVDLYKKL